MSTDQLLKKQKLHMDQLMQDNRVQKLVSHVADHAYQQGHNRRDPPPSTCRECEDLLKELFPKKVGEYA